MSASFALVPFVRDNISLGEIVRIVNKLMLNRLYGKSGEVLERAALILVNDAKDVAEYLDNEDFRRLIGVNFYRNSLWYKGENCEECIYLSCFARALKDENFDAEVYSKEVKYWLEKEINAEYQLDNLKK